MNDTLTMIRMRRAAIAKLRKDLDIEEAELLTSEKTILRLTSGQGGNGADASPKTQRDLVIATMRKSEKDWFENVAALHEEVQRVFEKEIKITSFQPLVSNMTGQFLRRDGQRVGLIERVGED